MPGSGPGMTSKKSSLDTLRLCVSVSPWCLFFFRKCMLEFVNFYLIPGLVLGSIYALGAIGVSMLFGILRFAHFAHGDLMTLGGYFALTLVLHLGWSPLAALPLAAVLTAIVAILVDRLFYRPFRT